MPAGEAGCKGHRPCDGIDRQLMACYVTLRAPALYQPNSYYNLSTTNSYKLTGKLLFPNPTHCCLLRVPNLPGSALDRLLVSHCH